MLHDVVVVVVVVGVVVVVVMLSSKFCFVASFQNTRHGDVLFRHTPGCVLHTLGLSW
jgi:hypothetical protein